MPAGTIALTNNSTSVTGNGTSFNNELKANDFIFAIVGGTPYTLGIASVNSDTSITLTVAYKGPSTSGAAWNAIPNQTLVGLTAQVVTDTAYAIRGLNYDKANWQGIYSNAESVTIIRPDMTTFTGPSWGYLASQYANKADKSALDAKADKSSLDAKADKSSLDAKADKSALRALAGMDSVDYQHINSDLQRSVFATHGRNTPGAGVWSFGNNPFGYSQYGINIQLSTRYDFSDVAGDGVWQQYLSLGANGELALVLNINGNYSGRKFYSTSNTSVSSSGAIMAASPIARIVNNKENNTRQDLPGTGNDFRREYQWASEFGLVNDEAEGCAISKKSTGTYIVTGAKSLAKDLWYVMDCGNGQGRIIALSEAEETAEGIEVRCYKQKFTLSEDGDLTVKKGELIDIPDNTWIDIRLEMPDDSIYNEKIRQGGGEGGR